MGKRNHENKRCDQKTVNGLFDFPNVRKDLRAKTTYHFHTNYFFGSFLCLLETPTLSVNLDLQDRHRTKFS